MTPLRVTPPHVTPPRVTQSVPQSLAFMPVSMFGAAMGLCGLALVSRQAHERLGVPAWIGELWAVVGILAFIVTAAAYALKFLRHRAAWRAELANPAQAGFSGAIAIALALVAGCVMPYDLTLARMMWWLAVGLILLIQVLLLARWLVGGIALDQVNTGWMIAVVGPIPIAGPGLLLGELEAARFIFGTAVIASVFVVGLVFHRTFFGTRIADGLRPTVFVLIVPFALVYAYGPPLWALPSHPVFTSFFDFALVLAAALAIFAWPAVRWPFTPAWWAFTFPLDALALAGLVYTQTHPSAASVALAWVLWLGATAMVMLVLVRTLLAMRAGALFVQPKPMPA